MALVGAIGAILGGAELEREGAERLMCVRRGRAASQEAWLTHLRAL